MSRFLIACGGTGGHLAPGLAVAENLVIRGHEARLLVSRKQVDKRLLEGYPDISFVAAPGKGFSPGGLQVFAFLYEQVHATWFARGLLKQMQPDVVLGFGGFTSVGVTLAASMRGVPVVLHEANRRPGRATKLLRGLATRVYLPEGMRLRGVSSRKTRHPGLPVRKGVNRISRERARRALGLEPEGRVLLILGGSQGAQALNQWAREASETLTQHGINLICLTGMGKGQSGSFERRSGTGEKVKAIYLSFSDEMGTLLSAADLAVSRAGAGTLAELAHCRLPSVLVPYGFAADNHQQANALYFERQMGGLIVPENRIGEVTREVTELIFNDWMLGRMRKSLARLDRPFATDAIARDLIDIAAGETESVRPHASLHASG